MVGEEEKISNKLDFEETELRLGLPGGGRKKSHDDNDTYNANGKRGFVDLKLNLSSDVNNIKASTLKTPVSKYVFLILYIFLYFSRRNLGVFVGDKKTLADFCSSV